MRADPGGPRAGRRVHRVAAPCLELRPDGGSSLASATRRGRRLGSVPGRGGGSRLGRDRQARAVTEVATGDAHSCKGASLQRPRHPFGTRLAETGVHLGVVRDRLGHASVATTQVYATWRGGGCARPSNGWSRLPDTSGDGPGPLTRLPAVFPAAAGPRRGTSRNASPFRTGKPGSRPRSPPYLEERLRAYKTCSSSSHSTPGSASTRSTMRAASRGGCPIRPAPATSRRRPRASPRGPARPLRPAGTAAGRGRVPTGQVPLLRREQIR